MINIKWGIFSGGVALVLAFTISLLVGAGFLTALLRAGIFAAIFFAMGAGAWTLINSYIPELLYPETQDETGRIFSSGNTGSRVNITLGDSAGAAFPETDSGLAEGEQLGNIDDLVSGKINPAAKVMDQTDLNGYTGNAGTNGGDGAQTGFSSDFSGFSGGGLEELDSLYDYDMSSSKAESYVSGAGERKGTGKKQPPAALEGDFNPKEIAAGIRTVLEKDKRG